jgi:hypothetical protein
VAVRGMNVHTIQRSSHPPRTQSARWMPEIEVNRQSRAKGRIGKSQSNTKLDLTKSNKVISNLNEQLKQEDIYYLFPYILNHNATPYRDLAAGVGLAPLACCLEILEP